jgi:hypothetical protein
MVTFIAVLAVSSAARSFYVSTTTGSDDNPGTAALPFGTVSKCVHVVEAEPHATETSSTCEIAAGTYREKVTLKNGLDIPPRALHGAPGATISGLDLLPSLSWQWEQGSTCIWSAALPQNATSDFSQLFYRKALMIEARWPNLDIDDVMGSALSRGTWQVVGNGSVYGRITAPALAQHPFSWDGALATLNVAHQFYTWTRTVKNHTQGSASFEYDKDLPSLASEAAHPNASWAFGCDLKVKSKCNQFFLSGKLGALDMPGEWYLDTAAHRLYFWPPPLGSFGSAACEPPTGEIEVKARDFAIEVEAASANVSISSLALHGAALRLDRCFHCRVEHVHLTYPTYHREALELNPPESKSTTPSTWLNGERLRVTNLTLLYTNNHGLKLNGSDIVVDNCRVAYTDSIGSLLYSPLGVTGNNISIRRCTVSHFGNAGVVTSIPNTKAVNLTTDPPPVPQPMAGRRLEVAYTHIFEGGTIGMDTASLYTGGWDAAGLEWHHNWVHSADEKCIRADDQSANMSVHHNVVWGCGLSPNADIASDKSGIGMIMKGDGHQIFANTIMRANYTEVCLPACVEPLKAFRKQYPLVVQNRRTQLFNSIARREVGFPCSCHNSSWTHHPGGNATANWENFSSWHDLRLADPTNFDFTPMADSPLVDAGAIIPPYTDGYVGKAPDVGAYERGGIRWRAGCVGLPGC